MKMNNYYDLEINILSCLLQKPKLMKELILEDKHFIKHQRIWQFMKFFYSKFETFDVVLMFNVCKDRFQLIRYLEWLVDVDPLVNNFRRYQEQLIYLYEQNENDKAKVKLIYELANDLYVGKIDLKEYIEREKKIIKDDTSEQRTNNG